MDDDLMVTMDAADYGKMAARIILNGTKGRAVTGQYEVNIETWDGQKETWPRPDGYQMDRIVSEIIAWMDEGTPFPFSAKENVAVLEAIVGIHASHARSAAWTDLPLEGKDREIEVLSG